MKDSPDRRSFQASITWDIHMYTLTCTSPSRISRSRNLAQNFDFSTAMQNCLIIVAENHRNVDFPWYGENFLSTEFLFSAKFQFSECIILASLLRMPLQFFSLKFAFLSRIWFLSAFWVNFNFIIMQNLHFLSMEFCRVWFTTCIRI